MIGCPRFAQTAAEAAAALVSHSERSPRSWWRRAASPEGENATEYTWLAGPVRLAIRDGWAGSATFHIQTLPSVTPTASVRPSGLNAAAQT